ncbi:hypothetical protein [Sulfitobacter guttiformis]|uniref:Secreted protein n=1 Tax=Sulfitobacter guttiformis TaxID=74349 RepID=A0A420DJT4_9RHOB|nr:hypothetical protein [Sulfitobacter guttiformis]KIN71674.1 hypothetical protein Z949_837 [Sulfitobacter guttiformis KCTC 32187]RKE94497.1 hypothetical protein C8N30_3625 [Sulfitobacter guttiformis]
MFKLNGLVLVAALGLVTAMPHTAAAETKIYPYASSENYCPAGLQPVTINGVICCGQPNQRITYQSAMAHPVAKAKTHRVVRKHRPVRSSCPVGTKGCTFD